MIALLRAGPPLPDVCHCYDFMGRRQQVPPAILNSNKVSSGRGEASMRYLHRLEEKCLGSLVFLFVAYNFLWEPDYIKVMSGFWDDVYDAGALLFLAFLALFYLPKLRRLITPAHICLMIMAGAYLFSTYYYKRFNPLLWKCLKYIWPIAGIIMLVDLSVRINARKTALAFYLMCYVQIVINVLTMWIFPDGIYAGHEGEPQYWLGNENVFIVTILAGLGAGAVSVCARGKKITWDYLLYLLVSILCVRLSVTSIFGLAVFVFMWLLHFVIKASWFTNPFLYQGVGCAGFFGIVIFHVQEAFSVILEQVFHKDATLTYRTILWRRVLRRFRRRPLIGYGVRTGKGFSKLVGGNPHWVHAHNYVLDIANKGGLLALVPFLLSQLFTARLMLPHMKKECLRVLSIVLLSYYVIFIGDCFEMRTPFYGILALCMNAAYLPGLNDSPEEQKKAAGLPDGRQ